MSVTTAPARSAETIADLLYRLGGIAPRRVRLYSISGDATEQDVLDIHDREGRLFELIDGVLVEKVMGYEESELALLLGHFLLSFVRRHKLGIVVGADGAHHLGASLVRIPDVSFVAWTSLPGRKRPRKPIPDLAPDLAVEILSKSNTKREIARKLREYFDAGTRLVWIIDPRSRTARVHTSADHSTLLTEDHVLDGDDLLPGFTLPLRELFPQAAM